MRRMTAVSLLPTLLALWACSPSGGGNGGSNRQPLEPEAGELVVQANRAIERQRYDLAAEYLRELDAAYPDLPESSMTWGRIYFAAGRLEEADSAYREVLRARPDQKGIYHNLGTVAFRAKQYREAVDYFEEEVERNPEAKPYHAMGLAYDRLAMADSARWAYERALALDSTFAGGYARLAQWYETSGEFDRAAEMAIRAHALEPGNRAYEAQKGRLLIRSGAYRDGIAVLTPLVRDDPLDYRSGFSLGRGWQMLGDHEKATRYLEQAEQARQVMQDIEAQMELVEDVPGNLNARLALAEALRRVGRLDQSILQYQIIESQVPANIGVKANLATLYMMTGDTASALRRYDEILARDSTVVEIWVNLCQFYVKTGRREKALEALAKAKRYGAGNRRVAALEEWMKQNLGPE